MKIKTISALLVIALTLSSCGLIVIGNDEGSRNPQVTETVDSAKSPESGDLTNSAESDDAGNTVNPETAADMLETFSGIFSADAAQKGLSLLKGREHELLHRNFSGK